MCVIEAFLLTKKPTRVLLKFKIYGFFSKRNHNRIQLSLINSSKYELQETWTEDDLNDFPLWGLSREAEDRKTSINKAAAPSGTHSKAHYDREGWRVTGCVWCHLRAKRSQALL